MLLLLHREVDYILTELLVLSQRKRSVTIGIKDVEKARAHLGR
jgi:hypothetical protein